MSEQLIEADFEQPMAVVFAALVTALGQERWMAAAAAPDTVIVPRAGTRFGYRRGRRICLGQVLECLRPVSIVIVERFQGPAGSVIVRQRWRIAPLAHATRLSGELRIRTYRCARLQLRFWRSHCNARAFGTCTRISELLRTADSSASVQLAEAHYSGSTGHSNGSKSIVSAKTIRVSGRPIFR